MREPKVTCNKCKSKFKIEPSVDFLKNGSEQTSFTCPDCDTEYIIAIVTPRGLAIREKIKLQRGKMKQVQKDKGRVQNYLNNQMRILVAQMEREVSSG